MKRKVVLFFISGKVPSPAELKKAEALGASFRNRSLIRKTDNAEACDEVFGEIIPDQYAKKPKAKLPEGFEIEEPEEGSEEAEIAAVTAELDKLGVKYRAGTKLETLKAKLAEAKATDPTE